MLKTLLCTLGFLFLLPNVAGADFTTAWMYSHALNKALSDLKSQPPPRATPLEGSCYEAYSRLYKKENIEIRIAYGYLDIDGQEGAFLGIGSRPHIATDTYMYEITVKRLLDHCRDDNIFACGFRRDASDATIFHKTMWGPFGKKHNIRLTLTHSSVSELESDNVGKYAEHQKIQSAQSRQNYLDGVEKADVVIYFGHARSGGGPDFDPPRRTSKGKVDYYGYYKKYRPGLNATLAALAKRTDGGPVFFGLAACSANDHFYKKISKLAPNSGFLLSSETSFATDAFRATIIALDGLLGARCKADMERVIHGPSMDKDTFFLRDFFRKVKGAGDEEEEEE